MGAALKLPDNVVPFTIPKRKPKIVEKEEQPFQKKFCVLPFRAVSDRRLHDQSLRVLATLCSYTNRAGITWVGQTTLAKSLGIHRQSVTRQFKLLRELGYIEIMSKGFRGERANTIRIIFDESINAEDAISVVSTYEDARPPYLVKQEEKEMDEAKRKALVEQASKLSKGFGKVNVFKVDTEPREDDSITVREMRVKIKEHQEKVKRVAKAKREKLSKDADELVKKVDALVVKPVDNSVENSESEGSHRQHHRQHPDVALVNDKDIYILTSKEFSNKLINIFLIKVKVINKLERVVTDEDRETMLSLVEAGLTEQLWTDVLEDTLQTMASKRQDPPHRISWFKSGLMPVLNAHTA